MKSLDITNEMREFFAKVQAGTNQGAIEWETTANRNLLVAVLDPEFIVRLERVTPERGMPGEPGPSYVLSLVKVRDLMFSLSPEDFVTVKDGLAESTRIFRDLWQSASLRTQRIAEDLDRVNRLLDELLVTTSFKPELPSKILAGSR